VGIGYPIGQTGDAVQIGGASHKMPLAGHEAVGDEPDGMAPETFAQNRQKGTIVVRREQRVRAARPPVHDVKEMLQRRFAKGVRHAMTSPNALVHSKPDAESVPASAGSRRSS
jgi:hypothetical protein